MSKLFFALVMLFSTLVQADKSELSFGTLPLTTLETQVTKKCRHGHKALPIFVSLDWTDEEFVHHRERVEVCPLCYKRLLSREAGY